MATTTTNYGFDIPQSTDLVKDGATAIATLGQDIDTAMNTALGTKKAGMVLLNTTSFSAVSAVNLAAGTFNATYDNYYFTFYGTSSIDSAIRVRLRVGGVNETASNYAQMTDARNPSTGGIGNYTSYTGGTQFSVGACKTAGHNLHGWIQTPFASARTSIFSTDIYDAEMNITTGMYKANTSYDALSFFPDGGTLTGTVSVYGYSK
jgi:hypothetical protein